MNFKTNIIKIEGKNLQGFFQNLITNDIKLLENNQALYSAMLTPQGKFISDFIIIKDKNYLLLEVNRKNTQELIELIKRYDLRETLKISLEGKMQTFFILFKNTPKDVLEKIEKLKVLKEDNYFIFFDPRKNNFLLRVWAKKNYLDVFPEKLKISLSEKNFNLERIKQTIPDSLIDLEKNKSFILNYSFDSLNAISFTKGCYIGQENTSRQNYRGKIKYVLKTLKLVEGNFPSLHEPLFAMSQKIGIMKSHIDNYGLALLRSDFFEANKLFSLDSNNAKIKII